MNHATILTKRIAIVALLILACSLSQRALAQQYTITDLGFPSGDTGSFAMGINSNGDVAGILFGGTVARRAFVWTAGGGIQTPLANVKSKAVGINDSGVVAGHYFNTPQSEHAYLWTSSGGMVDLGTLGGDVSHAGAINNALQIVGDAVTAVGSTHAFLYQGSSMTDLGTLGGGSVATGINDLGQVVGRAYVPSASNQHAFLWKSGGGMVDIGALPGNMGSAAMGINNAGQVVGYSYVDFFDPTPGHAFIWTQAGGMTDLGTLGGTYSKANAINDAGQVVGAVAQDGNSPTSAAIWTVDSGWKDLNTLIPPGSGWTLSEATAINQSGQIVGCGNPGDGSLHAFLLTPVTSSSSLTSVSVNPASVTGGGSSTGTVTLDSAAPADKVVALSSDNGAATVPAGVTVLAGHITADFTIGTTAVSVDTPVTISATLIGVTKTATLNVQVSRALTAFSLSPTSVYGGAISTGTVTISPAAPAGGSVVTLTSNKSQATVPVSVTVPQGMTQAKFTVNTTPVTAQVTASISATLGATFSKQLTIKPPVMSSVSLSPALVYGGASSNGTVTLTGATAVDTVVTLSSSASQATVPASVTVLAGHISATFTVTTVPVASQVIATISGTLGVTKTKNLTINPPALSKVALSPTSVVGGFPSTGTVTLTSAPAVDTVVALSSNRSEATVPGSVTVLAGHTTATFTVNTVVVYGNVTATITASLSGINKTANLTIKSNLVYSVTLIPSTVTGGQSSTGTVTLTSAAGTGGVIVTLSSDKPDATVPASVTVPAGQKVASFTVNTTPVGAQVLATITGSVGTSSKSRVLTINP